MPHIEVIRHFHDFFADAQVGLLKHIDALRCDVADDAHGKTGAGEGLAIDNVAWQAEFASNFADFVLEEFAQRLDQLELEVVRQAADVVVALDGGRGAADWGDGFDDVGVECALGEKFNLVTQAACLFGEDIDKGSTDHLALFFRIGNTG